MGIPISIIFLFASLIVFWIIPAIGIAKSHLVDDRFFLFDSGYFQSKAGKIYKTK